MPIVRNDVATKELSKRRVFVFLFVLVVLAIGATMFEESDIFMHAIDDYMLVGLAFVGLLIIAVSWKRQTVSQLVSQHNIITALMVIALIVQIFAIVIEMKDPADFGNEIPSLILIVLLLINRFA